MSSLFEFKMIVAVSVVKSIDKFVIYLTFMTLFRREVIIRDVTLPKFGLMPTNPEIWANSNQTLVCLLNFTIFIKSK